MYVYVYVCVHNNFSNFMIELVVIGGTTIVRRTMQASVHILKQSTSNGKTAPLIFV